MSRIVVAGALANRAGNGGGAAVRMTWVRGLQRLGFDVWFVEQLAPHLRGRGEPLRYFRAVTRRGGLEGRAALLDDNGARLGGVPRAELEEAATGAVLVNISGHLRVPSLLERFARRIFVDLDPGFTQFWHAEGLDAGALERHDAFFTVGLSVGESVSSVPLGGIAWHPLPPPVLLEEWSPGNRGLGGFTTVAAWRGAFGRVNHGGRTYGLKAHQFRRFLDLPRRLPAPAEIALDIHPGDAADLEALREHGWRVVDPRSRVADPESYRAYIQASGAELSVAQGIYVETCSGWFSDRTARYLAAGRPALVQDTGFSRHLPVGEGLLAFRTADEAVAGAQSIARDYPRHCARAREIAEEYLDSDRVLGRFCQAAGVAP